MKRYLITGASRGIGAATARLFAREGARVVLAARSEKEMTRIAEEIRAGGGELLAVNNAGMAGGNMPLVEVTEEVFDQVIAVNLKGVFLCLKYEIPALLAAGGGAIVNISSTVGLVGYGGPGAGLAPYIASKHGVVGLTKAAALEYAAQHIRVNAIAFGTILTEMNQHWYADEQIRQRMLSPIPMGRVADPLEAAEAILWLCSDAASYVTGVTLPVDGGYVIP